jgi:hypothetical protein
MVLQDGCPSIDVRRLCCRAYPDRSKSSHPMYQTPALIAFVLFASQAMASTDSPTEHELHTARCVAALEANTDDLAARVRAGRADLQALLLDRLKYGAAFIIDSYIRGERDEGRARGLLEAALEAQKTLPRQELTSRQSACAQEGARLLADADFVGRAVVSHLAQKRMKKLLEG